MPFKSSLLLFVFLILNGFSVTAQVEITGTVLHAETGEPVPYAYVKKKQTSRGAITNEDGFFQLMCNEGDTLIVSFVSFQKLEVPYTYFQKNRKLYLKPSTNELATVEVFANFDFLYRLFDNARKNLKQANDYPTKTYFSLESSTRGFPVEMLECYYNAEIGPSGINSLELKNGRVGMSALDDIYFASLNTTDIISGYRLMSRHDTQFPGNPLQLSKLRLKRTYRMRLIAFEDGIYKVKFKPKDKDKDFFESTIWIDKDTEQIVRVDLSQNDLREHPFVVIDSNHKMDSLDFNISYTFSNDAKQSLDKIEFGYDLNYNNGIQNRRMNTGGVFLFFEKDSGFDLPYYAMEDHELSDYDKIVAQPYNATFWEQNEVLSPSKKAKLYRKYFERVGVLLNFDNLAKHNSKIFKNRIVEWSENRVLLEEINDEGQYHISRGKDYHTAGLLSDFYDLSVHIYLDRNIVEDEVHYLSKTLINLDDSYYFLEPNAYTTCILNTYFDLVELERQNMMEVLELRNWSKEQVDSIYAKSQRWLEKNLDYYWKEVEHGENKAAITKYLNLIKGNLGIDNSLLILPELSAEVIESTSGSGHELWVQLYNKGTALLHTGKFDQALPLFEEAYGLGSRDPWLLYNLGLTYVKLGQIEKGCELLSMSKKMGEQVPKELVSECE